jgi:hypothetical protein
MAFCRLLLYSNVYVRVYKLCRETHFFRFWDRRQCGVYEMFTANYRTIRYHTEDNINLLRCVNLRSKKINKTTIKLIPLFNIHRIKSHSERQEY